MEPVAIPPPTYVSSPSPRPTTPISSMVPSPSNSCPSTAPSSVIAAAVPSTLRIKTVLQAPTAVTQKVTDDSPLTYLNKGQYYNVQLSDIEGCDGEISSTVSIMFHNKSHRNEAASYWKFWMSQHKHVNAARAIDIDVARCHGVQQVETPYFDSISFRWNGKAGATVGIQFNCLSTDFSRIKGVKGIPLQLHIMHRIDQGSTVEQAYCRIKLFRDKGAERKNKDDVKYVERQIEKIRGKTGKTHPLWTAYTQTQPCTIFWPVPNPPVSSRTSSSQQHEFYDKLRDQDQLRPMFVSPAPQSALKRSYYDMLASPHLFEHDHRPLHALAPTTTTSGAFVRPPCSLYPNSVPPPLSLPLPLPLPPAVVAHRSVSCVDPCYVSQGRRRAAKLCLFAKFANASLYRAVYLEDLSVHDLRQKLVSKMDAPPEQSDNIKLVRHVTTSGERVHVVAVEMDDRMVQDIPEEQAMQIDCVPGDDDGLLTLVLHY